MSNAILQKAAALASKTYTAISTASYPLPQDAKSPTYDQGATSAVILLGMAFVIIPTGFVPDIVRERQVNICSKIAKPEPLKLVKLNSLIFVQIIEGIC